MSDERLEQFRREPPREFADALYARLLTLPDERVSERTAAETLRSWLLRRALPSFSLSFLLMAFVAGLLPPLRAGLWELASGRRYEAPAALPYTAVPMTVATAEAQTSLPVTLTRIPQWTPAGFVLSGTLTAYKLLTGTFDSPNHGADQMPDQTHLPASTRVDYTWHDELGRQITLALQSDEAGHAAQPITATSLLQVANVHGYSATLSELTYQPGWVSLSWAADGVRYNLLAPQDVLSSTLIKMAESIPNL